MIAEALDAGVVSVAAVGGLLGAAIIGGIAWGSIRTQLGHLTEAIRAIGKRMDKHEDAAQEHRHDDNTRFHEQSLTIARLTGAMERDGLLTPPPRDTGPHPPVRSKIPRPRDTGDTDTGLR